MKKITFSLRRILAVVAIYLLGTILATGTMLYFLLPEPADFTYVQWFCVFIGAMIVPTILQYVLINLVKKHMPLEKEAS